MNTSEKWDDFIHMRGARFYWVIGTVIVAAAFIGGFSDFLGAVLSGIIR